MWLELHNSHDADNTNIQVPETKASSLNSLVLSSLTLLLLISAGPLSSEPNKSLPTLAVTGSTSLTTIQGGGAVRSHLVFTNAGSATMDWTASSNQTWFRFEPASGSLAPQATASVDLVADPAGFSPGIYIASAKVVGTNVVIRSLDVTMTEQSAFADSVGKSQRTFPQDSGMVDVKTAFGAKGDGVTDDTQAIQQAISSTVHHAQAGARIVYFPAGTYLVSHPIFEKDPTGHWNSLLTLQGENRATTIIKLSDNNPLYQNASTPTEVVRLASQNGGPKGGGNSAFDNNIFDITIDVGRGNPGAIALDFMGNNYCALRNVTLQSSDSNHAGAIGLAMLRYASGPCLMKNMVINGFDYGIKVANTEYSLTFEDLTLLNQRLYGVFNAGNVLSIRHLFSNDSVPVIHNQDTAGLITLIGAILRAGSSQKSAIENQGTLYARDVNSSGYVSAVQGQPGADISEYDSGPTFTQFGSKASSLNLPIEETPQFEDEGLNNWKSVIAFGADPSGRADSSAAIQAAIDSGATTVYFPTGVYLVAKTVMVRGRVRMLQGFDSSLNPVGDAFSRSDNLAPLVKIEEGNDDVTLDHFRIGAFYPRPVPGVIFLQQDSSRGLVVRDSIVGSYPTTVAYQNTLRGTGPLFVENVAATPWQILFPQNVFARQINPEGNKTKITNKGGKLWILGLKTEGRGTNIETEQAGSTEILGGLIYPVWNTGSDSVGFEITDSRASFIYAVSSHKPAASGTNFAVQIREIQHGVTKSLPSTSLPVRELGTMVGLYSSEDRPLDFKK